MIHGIRTTGWHRVLRRLGGQECGKISRPRGSRIDPRSHSEELGTLVHFGFEDPALPDADGHSRWDENDPLAAAGAGLSAGFFWSSTSLADDQTLAWILDSTDGFTDFDSRDVDDGQRSWPVRDT